MSKANLPSSVANGTGANDRAKPVWSASSSPKFVYREPTYQAIDFGVIADGAQHNNVANLLDCIAIAVANGVKRIELPAGTIVTTEAVLGSVTADSGRTYTNNGGLPLPPGLPLAIEGQGQGITVLQLSAGLPRAFDFRWIADGQQYAYLTLRRFTVDANNVSGASQGPLTAVTAATTIPNNGVWTTLPGVSATAFANAKQVWFPPTNSGTAAQLILNCRVSSGNLQVQNSSGATGYTLNSGDQVTGALQGHRFVGNYISGGSSPRGWNMSIDHFTVEDINTINVPTNTSTGLGVPSTTSGDASLNIDLWVMINAGFTGFIPSITNTVFRRVTMNGGSQGISIAGAAGTFIDQCGYEQCWHDTLVQPSNNYTSENFLIGKNAWVGKIWVNGCYGARSGDVALEIDQPWEAHLTDNTWVDSFSGNYRTTFVPPARTSAGPPIAIISNGGTAITSSAVSIPIVALPTAAARQGLILIDSELLWYQANAGGTSLAVYRAVNGTTATSHADADAITFVETSKTRVYDIRTTIYVTNSFVATAGGRGFLAFSNSSLPIPPITCRDATIDHKGGGFVDGQHFFWQGWCPEVDVEGMRITHNGISNPTVSSGVTGSAFNWSWTNGPSQRSYVPCPTPRIIGRNNIVMVTGTSATGNNYSAFRAGAGWALLDFDLTTDLLITGASAGSGVNGAYLAPGSSQFLAAALSHFGIKIRCSNANLSDAAMTGIVIPSSAFLNLLGEIILDVDTTEMAFVTGTGDTNYRPYNVDATQLGKVRFGRIAHSTSAAVKYPSRKENVVRVTTSGSPYTSNGMEDEIHVDSNLGVVTINLPSVLGGASNSEYLGRGRDILIVDTGYAAGTYAITLTAASTDKINAGTTGGSVTLNTNGAHLRLTPEPGNGGWFTAG
jgi:hypothetical protein